MNTTSQTLLDLHLAFELQRLQTKRFGEDLRLTLEQLFQTFADTPLNDCIDSATVTQLINHHILESQLQKDVGKLIQRIASDLYADDSHQLHSPKSLISRDQVERLIDKALTQESLRSELIHQGMSNAITHAVVAEVLYSGISSYIMETNAISRQAQKVPGAKAMMKMSKGIINKAAPKLEEKLEAQIKKYIGSALPDVIAQSEDFIAQTITEATIKDITLGLWDSMEDANISDLRDYISQDDAEDYARLVYEQCLSSRQSNYIAQLCQSGVESYFRHYGHTPLGTLCHDFGISPQGLTDSLLSLAPDILNLLHRSGFLEQHIRARLQDFYSSEPVQTLLDEHTPSAAE